MGENPNGEIGAHKLRKTVIVTGCSGEIGRAIARAFRGAGYTVVGIDKASRDHEEEHYYTCDLSDVEATDETLRSIRRDRFKIDVLVNNAGIYKPSRFFDLTTDDFDATMNVNVRSVFQLSQQIARWMIEDKIGGSIINLSSISGRLGSPIIPYATSKSAVIGLTRSLSMVLAPNNIRVNAIAPGMIDTQMIRDAAPEQIARQMTSVPMARLGTTDEIAKVCLFLASDASSYMSGTTLDVNGGWPC
jgi:NAD(P)-dependent dehydrogenase (short-subunit alcohol dehydrogenase family)